MDSTITSKGQATIPKAIRDYLGVKPGDKLRFFVRTRGGAVILPVLPASAARGMLKATRHVSIAEMRDVGPGTPRRRR